MPCLAQLSFVKASLPQFSAASAPSLRIVEAVMAVARPYPDASGSRSTWMSSENAAVGMGKRAAVAIARM